MAITKGKEAITQVTVTGQSDILDVAAAYRASLYITHVNGTGTITAGAVVNVQVRPNDSTLWYSLVSITEGLTASETKTRVITLPDDVGDVRIDYTSPTGSTGHTLDAEVGKVTAI